jgi:hypothetical protein
MWPKWLISLTISLQLSNGKEPQIKFPGNRLSTHQIQFVFLKIGKISLHLLTYHHECRFFNQQEFVHGFQDVVSVTNIHSLWLGRQGISYEICRGYNYHPITTKLAKISGPSFTNDGYDLTLGLPNETFRYGLSNYERVM